MEGDLLLQGFSLAGLIVLVVQALKVSGVQDEKWLGLAPWLTAIVALILYGLVLFVPAAGPIVEGALKAVIGAVGAVLGYFYAVKPAGRAIGVSMSTGDIEAEEEDDE